MNRKHRALVLPLAVAGRRGAPGRLHYADRSASLTPTSMPAKNPIPVTTVSAPAPVVVSPAPTSVVVSPAPNLSWSPAPTQVVVSPAPVTTTPVCRGSDDDNRRVVGLSKVINYAEGRYQLYGDRELRYYWVWIPAGDHCR